MGKTIIVSNRLPVNVTRKNDELHFSRSIGGLATGLLSVHKSSESIWLGWCGLENDKLHAAEFQTIEQKLASDYQCVPIFLSSKEINLYYNCFSNKIIWPMFHYFPMLADFRGKFWDEYHNVNRIFANSLKNILSDDDILWIHDYQLMLLPEMVREEFPDCKIGFFLHIPFPSFEIFRLIPWRKEILSGILGADLVGFHTYDYVRHFISSVRRLLRYDHHLGTIIVKRRIIAVDAFPMGIDFDNFSSSKQDPVVLEEIKNYKKKIGTNKIILSVDRLDYTKGIPHRLYAFEHFLETNPQWKEKVTFILIVAPSRTNLDQYKELKSGLDERISKINGKHGTLGWIPIWYFFRTFSVEHLKALYCLSDVLLVTPLRDGMNLIVKEYIATRTDKKGVVIISETAGAASELGESLVVNPNDIREISSAILTALTMPLDEQIRINTIQQNRLKHYDVDHWSHDFLEKLHLIIEKNAHTTIERLTEKSITDIKTHYRKSHDRLILLDYDGTLMSFQPLPEMAKPNDEILTLLNALCSDPHNTVVLISGRDKPTLNNWFGSLPINLVAGHGVWFKKRGKQWRLIEKLNTDWKEVIMPVIRMHTNRTPGSLAEEKEFSIAWHYRKCDPDLATVRVAELKETLIGLTANLNIGILEGNKVIEVKNTSINKGRAASLWLNKPTHDFILCIGDDWTDEHMFDVLPKTAFSIKVGYGFSAARYSIQNASDVRALLLQLSELSHPV